MNSLPSICGKVIINKDGVVNVWGYSGVNPLENYIIEAFSERKINSFGGNGGGEFIFLRRRDDMI